MHIRNDFNYIAILIERVTKLSRLCGAIESTIAKKHFSVTLSKPFKNSAGRRIFIMADANVNLLS